MSTDRHAFTVSTVSNKGSLSSCKSRLYASGITGKIVKYCLEKKKTLGDLDLGEFKRFSEMIEKDVFNYITIDASISKKGHCGGTAKKRVIRHIKQIKTGK